MNRQTRLWYVRALIVAVIVIVAILSAVGRHPANHEEQEHRPPPATRPA